MKWPVREGLLRLIDMMKQDALEEFRHQKLTYAIGGGRKPVVPDILKS